MLIDFMLPVYNRLEYTKMSIPSILANKFDFRLTVINDGSTEPGIKEYLRKVANRDKRVNLIENERNLGLSTNTNRFWSKIAKAEFVGKFDNDAIIPPNCVESLYKFITKADKVGIVGSFPFPKTWGKRWTLSDMGGGMQGVAVKFIGGIGYIMRKKLTELYPIPKEGTKMWGWTNWQRRVSNKHKVIIAYAYPLIPIIHLCWLRRDMEEKLYQSYNGWSQSHRPKNRAKQAKIIYEKGRLKLVQKGGVITL